jgi:hypothetical protein
MCASPSTFSESAPRRRPAGAGRKRSGRRKASAGGRPEAALEEVEKILTRVPTARGEG